MCCVFSLVRRSCVLLCGMCCSSCVVLFVVVCVSCCLLLVACGALRIVCSLLFV